MGHNPLWCCIQIPIENSLSKHKCTKNSNATSKKYLASLWRVMQGLQEYFCPFSFNFRGYIGSIFIGRLVRSDFQFFSRFHLVSLEFIANFLFIFCHFTFHIMSVCRFVAAGVQRLSVMVLPLFTTVHWWTRIMVVIVIRTRSCCCYKSLVIKSPCG